MRVIAVLCLAVAGSMSSTQSSTPPSSAAIETAHLSVTTSTSAAGDKPLLLVDVSPKPKMHVYAPGEKDAIPVEVTLDPNPSIKAGRVTFPPSEKYFFPPLQLTQRVYSKPFRITQPVAIVRTPADGTVTITGTLRYQACDDAVCYVPKSVPLKWLVKRP
jgi:DsbC/DsbD-like thiol-disulfide interchange protein